MRKVGAGAALALFILASCASGPSPTEAPAGTSEISPDSSQYADYDRMFLEIHSVLTSEIRELEKKGKGGTTLAEVQSIVETAEEFYLEGKPLTAIRLLTEAELLLRQISGS